MEVRTAYVDHWIARPSPVPSSSDCGTPALSSCISGSAIGPLAPPHDESATRGYLTVDATNSDLESAIDISKNTITKLTRILQDLRVCTVTADRNGYHFRLGEWVTVPAADLSLPLTADVFYLDALVSRSDVAQSRPDRGIGAGNGRA